MTRHDAHPRKVAILIAGALLVALLPAAGASASEDPPAPLPLLVGFAVLPDEVRVDATLHGARVADANPVLAYALVHADDADAFRERARDDARIVYVEEDRADVWPLLTPNDPLYGDQYGLRQVRAHVAWDTTLGATSTKICIVDSGVRASHQDLAGPRYLGGYDFVNNDATPNDGTGHGTFVTSVAAATTNDGRGLAGTAQVSFYAVRVLGATGGSQSDVADGIQWCADHGAHVINLSLGASSGSSTLQSAVAYAWSKGSLLVGAAGNDGSCSNCVNYPAAYGSVIAVTGTTASEGQWTGTSDGPQSELAAPAHEIRGAYYSGDASYATGSGTSAAAPHVTGVAALVHAAAPHLSNQDLRDVLAATARDKGAPGRDDLYGHGIVDAGAALATIIPGAPQDLAIAQGEDPTTLTLSWSPPTETGSTPIVGYRIYRGTVGGEGLIRDDDGTAENWLDYDHSDDTAIKYLLVPQARLDEADQARLWVYGRSYSCGVPGDSHSLALNRLVIARFNPCELFPEGEADWAGFDVAVDDLLPAPLENRFSFAQSTGDWTDRNLVLGIDTDNDEGRTTASQNGNNLEGELMWALSLGPERPSTPFELAAEVGNVLSYVDNGAPGNTTVRYRVTAVNGAGEGAPSTEIRATTGRGPPGPPADLSVVPSSTPGRIDLTWSAPATDGGSPVTAYRVYRGTSSDDLPLIAETTARALADTGLEPGVTYWYRVTAVSELGEGVATATIAVQAPGAPTTPRSVHAAPGSTVRAIYVSWEAPEDSGGFPLAAYRVYWSATGEDPMLVAELDASRTQFVDARPELLTPKAHFYWVSAVNTLAEGPLSARTCAYAGAYDMVWLTMEIECDLAE